LTDPRYRKFALILADHSARIKPGIKVGIYSTTNAEPIIRPLFQAILERGGQPHLLLDLPDREEILFAQGNDDLLDYISDYHYTAFEEFDVLFKIRAETNTRALSQIDPARVSRREKALAKLINTQMARGATHSLRWMSTIYPTNAYAMDAEMGLEEYRDFFFKACHVDDGTPDPVKHWQNFDQRS